MTRSAAVGVILAALVVFAVAPALATAPDSPFGPTLRPALTPSDADAVWAGTWSYRRHIGLNNGTQKWVKGTMSLSQQGTTVTGSFAGGKWQLQATVKGDQLDGTMRSNKGGKGEFTLSIGREDRFGGTFWYKTSPNTYREWTGKCVGGPCLANRERAITVTAVADGRATCTQPASPIDFARLAADCGFVEAAHFQSTGTALARVVPGNAGNDLRAAQGTVAFGGNAGPWAAASQSRYWPQGGATAVPGISGPMVRLDFFQSDSLSAFPCGNYYGYLWLVDGAAGSDLVLIDCKGKVWEWSARTGATVSVTITQAS